MSNKSFTAFTDGSRIYATISSRPSRIKYNLAKQDDHVEPICLVSNDNVTQIFNDFRMQFPEFSLGGKWYQDNDQIRAWLRNYDPAVPMQAKSLSLPDQSGKILKKIARFDEIFDRPSQSAADKIGKERDALDLEYEVAGNEYLTNGTLQEYVTYMMRHIPKRYERYAYGHQHRRLDAALAWFEFQEARELPKDAEMLRYELSIPYVSELDVFVPSADEIAEFDDSDEPFDDADIKEIAYENLCRTARGKDMRTPVGPSGAEIKKIRAEFKAKREDAIDRLAELEIKAKTKTIERLMESRSMIAMPPAQHAQLPAC